jgi:uncharacterized protein YcfJ
MTRHPVKMFVMVAVGTFFIAGSAAAQSTSPRSIQQRYGVQGAYTDTTTHPGGLRSTVVPVTLADGRTGQLVIPSDSPRTDPHAVYYRDADGSFHPVQMNVSATRRQVVKAPRAVRYQTEPQHTNKQSWEKDAMIVGGSAGGGALIGATAGGKKGALVGAATGGVGGLIYDLLSRNKK